MGRHVSPRLKGLPDSDVCKCVMAGDEVLSKDLYGGRYRVFSDGRLMNVATGAFVGNASKDIVKVGLFPVAGGKKINTQLKKVVYEAFVKPLDKRGVLLHRNGDWRDCSVGNIYQKGNADSQVIDANRHKYPSPEYAFGPAPFSRYVAKRTGELFNAMTGGELFGNPGNAGMVLVNLSNDDGKETFSTMAKSRFVYACFHPDFDLADKKTFVIRLDGDNDNNDISNFKAGTPADMLKNARELDPTIAKRAGASRARPIEVINSGGDVVETYNGTLAAAKALGMGHLALQGLVNSGQTLDGLVYRRPFPELDVPEAWYKIRSTELPEWVAEGLRGLEGTYVSDAGRVISPSGYLYTDDPDKKRGYRMFQRRFYHIVVCFAFNGPPSDPGDTADHRNRDILDNRAVNLRWATKEEQATNMSVTMGVERTCVATGKVDEYPSKSAASRASGMSMRRISEVCRSGDVCQGFTWTETGVSSEKELEGQVTGHPGVTEPVDYEFVRRMVHRHASDI
jgi:HNH endonuclease